MKISSYKSNIKTLRPGDANFMITDGMMITPRAGFELNAKCPEDYKRMIMHCVDIGWLKPVAHIHHEELVMDSLTY